MRWWPGRKRLTIPETEENGETESKELLEQSQRKLRETRIASREVKRVTDKSKWLNRNNHFAESLEQAMRRAGG